MPMALFDVMRKSFLNTCLRYNEHVPKTSLKVALLGLSDEQKSLLSRADPGGTVVVADGEEELVRRLARPSAPGAEGADLSGLSSLEKRMLWRR